MTALRIVIAGPVSVEDGSGGGGGGEVITRTVTNIIGTETGSGVTVADNGTLTSAEIDILGNNESKANINLYVSFTSAITDTGSVDVSILPILNAGSVVYKDAAPVVLSVAPNGGTLSACANLPSAELPSARYFKILVANKGTGADITDVFVGVEVSQES